MRPLTEALLRGNTEDLTQRGWKQSEQIRCFKKADALLDYISRIKPGEFIQTHWGRKLNDLRFEGIRYHLKKDMPSKEMQNRSLEVLSAALSIGEELMLKAAWLYRNYPVLFKANYALSEQTYQMDARFYFINRHIVPENSFPAFKVGTNPAVSRDNNFLNKCIKMYNDPIFKTPQFQDFLNQPTGKKFPYIQWIRQTKAGKRFYDETRALQHVIEQLSLENKVGARLGKALTGQLLQNKQKTN